METETISDLKDIGAIIAVMRHGDSAGGAVLSGVQKTIDHLTIMDQKMRGAIQKTEDGRGINESSAAIQQP